jgi:hypothetical protein
MIIGLFEQPEGGANAVDSLVEKGVDKDRISIVATEQTAKESFAVESQTKGAEGAAIGGGVGAAAGALLAGLTTVGALATGGATLLVAGPIVAAFTGAGAGAVTGGAIGGLIGLGFNEEEVKHFEDSLDKGAVLVGVNMENADDEDLVKDTLKAHKPKEVSSS